MSDDLIKREDAIEALKGREGILHDAYTAVAIIRAVPSADTDISEYSDKLWRNAYERGKADRPQGEWVLSSGGYGYIGNPVYKCSACGWWDEQTPYNYCPNCGARMKGADNE